MIPVGCDRRDDRDQAGALSHLQPFFAASGARVAMRSGHCELGQAVIAVRLLTANATIKKQRRGKIAPSTKIRDGYLPQAPSRRLMTDACIVMPVPASTTIRVFPSNVFAV